MCSARVTQVDLTTSAIRTTAPCDTSRITFSSRKLSETEVFLLFYLYVDLLCIQTLIYSYFIGHIAKPAHHEKCKDFVKSNEFAADLYNAAPLIY